MRDVHAMREHYVRTVSGWLENFEANLPRLTEVVGEEVVRVWRLYSSAARWPSATAGWASTRS